ncbi:hypothetical protein HUU39_14835 [candidate division KSB1 bacterium]|nr:hypothetical protein [bacterium]NUM66518.1 hypothetical protein [candidate division KSB1 bacterium]
MSNGNPSSSSGAKNFLWVVVALLLIVIVGYNLYSGFAVKKIKISDIFEAEFAEKPQSVANPEQLKQVGEEELKQRQADLENKLAELEGQLRQRTPPVAGEQALLGEPSEAAGSNVLAGTWHSAQGVSYLIQQNAAALTIQEINPLYGITAVGQGAIAGQSVQFSISTAAGTWGTAQLTLSADGRQLAGRYADLVTGLVVPLALHR